MPRMVPFPTLKTVQFGDNNQNCKCIFFDLTLLLLEIYPVNMPVYDRNKFVRVFQCIVCKLTSVGEL